MPDVFEIESRAPDLDAVWKVVAPACEQAVAQCQSMRTREGGRLAEDFVLRVHHLEDVIRQIRKRGASTGRVRPQTAR